MEKFAFVIVLSVSLVFSCGVANAAPKGFTDDFDSALASAKKSGKQLWVLFTGSDWHSGCKTLEQKILSRPRFAAAGEKHFEMVYLDYPMDKSLVNPKFELRNLALLNQYHVEDYPAVVVIDPDGRAVFNAECPVAKESSRQYFDKVVARSRKLTDIRYLQPLKVEFAAACGEEAPTSEKKIVRLKNGRLALRAVKAGDALPKEFGLGQDARRREILARATVAKMPGIIADERKRMIGEFEAKIRSSENHTLVLAVGDRKTPSVR